MDRNLVVTAINTIQLYDIPKKNILKLLKYVSLRQSCGRI
jgi:hypothetical protein